MAMPVEASAANATSEIPLTLVPLNPRSDARPTEVSRPEVGLFLLRTVV
jgi:hypothetical protein